MAGDTGRVAGVRAGNGLQDKERIFDVARHGAKLVEGPAKRHRPGARDSSVCWTESGDSAAHRWADDAAAGFAADGESYKACSRGRAGAGTGSGGTYFRQPRIHCLAAEPDVVQCECAEAE